MRRFSCARLFVRSRSRLVGDATGWRNRSIRLGRSGCLYPLGYPNVVGVVESHTGSQSTWVVPTADRGEDEEFRTARERAVAVLQLGTAHARCEREAEPCSHHAVNRAAREAQGGSDATEP